jgi:hypothetical protein
LHRALLLALALGCEGTTVPVAPPPDDGPAPTTPTPTIVANAAPTAPGVSIAPELPADTTDLVCGYSPSSDPDGDALTYAVSWRRDGAAWTGATASTALPGDTIPAEVTRQEDIWTCEVEASDGVLGTIGSMAVVVAYWPVEDLQFEPCDATGAEGPDQDDCDGAYASGPLQGLVQVADGLQQWTVPATGEYWLTAVGAQGASANPNQSGGRGALVAAPFVLEAGSVLTVAVGQRGVGDGTLANGGGGGGTWVALDGEIVLVAAGGGGVRGEAEQDGCDGNVGIDAIPGSGCQDRWECEIAYGSPGSPGGASALGCGAGGAGVFGDGASDRDEDDVYGTGGATWDHGLRGGACTAGQPLDGEGGFGGGGAGCGWYGGGGGGGYTGGGGGAIGGGGGSFAAGSIVVGQSGANDGDGWLAIDLLEDDTISGP